MIEIEKVSWPLVAPVLVSTHERRLTTREVYGTILTDSSWFTDAKSRRLRKESDCRHIDIGHEQFPRKSLDFFQRLPQWLVAHTTRINFLQLSKILRQYR